jgi:pimeloyl-ACP methyl ester carboxylesterase
MAHFPHPLHRRSAGGCLGEAAGPASPRLVFVPGVMGSALFDAGSREVIWGTNAMLGWAPRMGQWIAAMGQGNGIDSPGNVVPQGFTRLAFPLRSIAEIVAIGTQSPAAIFALRTAVRQFGLRNVEIDPYGDALRFFAANLGPQNVLAFSYDWRLGNLHSAALLKRAIERRWGDSLADPTRPLTIVGHSMGGIVSRHYIEQLGGSRVIRNLVTVGTPHEGAPDALLAPTSLPALTRFLMPLDVAAWTAPLALPPLLPLALAMPLLHLFADRFLRELQSLLLHFAPLYELLPGVPFVRAGSPTAAPEPLAATYAALARDACATAAQRPARLACVRPFGELRRPAELLRVAAHALPGSVNYLAIANHILPTTVGCQRTRAGALGAIHARCGDGTVPAFDAVLPHAANVRNRFLETALAHSDLLRDRRVLETCVNVARAQSGISVPGVVEVAPACVPRPSLALRMARSPAIAV